MLHNKNSQVRAVFEISKTIDFDDGRHSKTVIRQLGGTLLKAINSGDRIFLTASFPVTARPEVEATAKAYGVPYDTSLTHD